MKRNEKDCEIRQVTLQEVRLETREEGGDGPLGSLYGVAAVYDQESVDLGGFVETIERGFFENVLNDDAFCLWNHNDDAVLGRRKSGTLEIWDTEKGLAMRAKLPDTSWGRDARVSVERGDVDQMSFMFVVRKGGDRWVHGTDGIVRRRLLRGGCERLYEVSPVTFPGYPQTSVAARSAFDEFNGRLTGNDAQEGESEELMGKARAQARQANRMRKIKIEMLRGGS